MKRETVLTLAVVLLGLVTCGLTVCGCKQSPAGDEAKQSPAGIKEVLASQSIPVAAEHAGTGPVILIIGENHASVKSQKQLADLLGALLDKKAVSALLIEGSAGPVDTRSARSKFQSAASSAPADLNNYWEQSLLLGEISGYEFVAMTRPDVRVEGIEDMAAKMRCLGVLEKEGRQSGVAEDREAATRLRKAIDSIAARNPQLAAPLREKLTGFESAISQKEAATAAYGAVMDPIFELEARRIALVTQFREPKFAAILAAAKKGESLNNFDQSDITRLENAAKEIKQVQDEETAKESGLTASNNALKQVSSGLDDQFFVLANEVQAAGKATGIQIDGVQNFFSDMAAIREKEEAGKSRKAQLLDRDVAMASNTASFVGSNPGPVVMIVGSAHVEGLIDQLTTRNLSFVAAKLPTNDSPLEPWEGRASARREQGAHRVFSMEEKDGDLKELTRLLQDRWIQENSATLSALKGINARIAQLPAINRARMVEGIVQGRPNLAMRVGDFGYDPGAEFGRHVVRRGAMFGKPGQHYEVYDRAIGATIGGRRRDAKVFAYIGRNENDVYKVNVEGATVDLPHFVENLPLTADNAIPNWVVLIAENDEEVVKNVSRSPSREMLRGPGGPGNPPPPGNHWAAAYGFPENSRRPENVVWSIDDQRAERNIAAIERQKQIYVGDVQFIEEAVLLKELPFTPERGDYSNVYVITARNVPECRAAIAEAAKGKKLVNKQIALVMCGDANGELSSLREQLLNAGALLVWTPDRQVTPAAAEALKSAMINRLKKVPAEQHPKALNRLIYDSLDDLHRQDPNSAAQFWYSASWTLVLPSATSPSYLDVVGEQRTRA